MNKLLFIVGPTATGKTAIARKFAHKFSGQLISADSRQVYQGMDIGTGKDLPPSSQFHEITKELHVRDLYVSYGYYDIGGIPLWLLDLITPHKVWSVSHFQYLAHKTISTILKKNNLPIVVGGTGLYMRSLTSSIDTINIPPNALLRKKLNDFSVKKLQEFLEKTDNVRLGKMNNSDRNNPVRLIRAVEIALTREKSQKKYQFSFDVLKIGLSMQKDELQKKIDERVDRRVKEGILDEVQLLLKNGFTWDCPGMSGLGYRQLRKYFEKKESFSQAINIWKQEEHQYAKRQMTWFRRDPEILWFDVRNADFYGKIEEKVEKWYTSQKAK